MCCCLSSLRRFFKHFAPRLIGESSNGNSKPRSQGFSRNNAQRTFGSGGAKRTLDTLMHTKNDDNGIPLSSFDDLDKGAHTGARQIGKDSDSEEAILFERSVQVTYEDRKNEDQNNPSAGRGYEQGLSNQPQVWTGGRRSSHAR